MPRQLGLFVLPLFILLLAACGGSAAELEITDVWGRNSPMAAQNGAFYMTIRNGTDQDEQLLSASAEICDTTELHEMFMQEGDVMGMRPVEGGIIDIPAGETVSLQVGGLHVMCLGKRSQLDVGDEVPITLEFAQAGTVEVSAEIRETAPGS
jgi:copper(I)-binding protein